MAILVKHLSRASPDHMKHTKSLWDTPNDKTEFFFLLALTISLLGRVKSLFIISILATAKEFMNDDEVEDEE